MFTNWLTDAHIHLSDLEFKDDIDIILTSMDKLKIKACCVSVDYQSSQDTLELSRKSPLILPFLGLHPEKAGHDPEPILELIKNNSLKISGIGEIGLDKTYVSSADDFENQKVVFEKMLSVAEKHQKPVSIHSRKTLEEIFSTLPSYRLNGVLLHWFAGSKKELKKAMDLDCFVSYGPAAVYADDKQVLLRQTEINKILLETDGPVKFSRCFGFKTAQISFLPSVLFSVSSLLGKTYDETLSIIERNTTLYLGV